jgi:hypothetical protein
MARKIDYGGTTSSTLSVSLSEAININGKNYGSNQRFAVTGVNNVSRRIISVPTATNGAQIYAGAAASSIGTHISTKVKYIRITNLDDTNSVILHIEGNSHYAQIELEPGRNFVLGKTLSLDNANDIDNYSAETITKIDAKSVGNPVDVEIFIAESSGV